MIGLFCFSMAFCNLDKAVYDGVGRYDFPKIEPFTEDVKISNWIRFTDIGKCKLSQNTAVHFFQDDYKFESIWNRPLRYIDKFRRCGLIVQPDFSMYTDFPIIIQMYNKYRNHWLARFYSDRGIKVLPYVMWSTPESYEWCFDGMPKGSVVSVTTNGTLRDRAAHNYFLRGFAEMQKRLWPKKIIVFTVTNETDSIGLDYGNIEYVNCAVRNTLLKKQRS